MSNQTKAQRGAQILASAYACFEVAKHLGLAGESLAICAQNLIGAQKGAGVQMVDAVTLDAAANGSRPHNWPTAPSMWADSIKAGHVTQAEVLTALHDADPHMAGHAAIIAAARSFYAVDECEIDDKPLLSPAEGGAWVSAWVWVAVNDFDCACQNCNWTGKETDTKAIKHYAQRVAAGEPAPAGECPACGALAHLVGDR